MVQLVAKYTGRGPTKARTTIGRDHVLVLLADTLTKGERSLVAAGFGEQVLTTRRMYQTAMRSDAIELVEGVTGRKVVGFMSDNHLDPDFGAEVFVLDPNGSPFEYAHEADSDDSQP
jgi:uncharacterized protein YbcI